MKSAEETGIPLDCGQCDLPDLLKGDFCPYKSNEVPELAKTILELYYAFNSKMIVRNPELTNFIIAMHRPEMTQTEAKMIFWGLNLIENLVQEHVRQHKDKNSDHNDPYHSD